MRHVFYGTLSPLRDYLDPREWADSPDAYYREGSPPNSGGSSVPGNTNPKMESAQNQSPAPEGYGSYYRTISESLLIWQCPDCKSTAQYFRMEEPYRPTCINSGGIVLMNLRLRSDL